MDKSTLDTLCQQVYRKFPNVKGLAPVVTKQGEDRYLLVFTGSGATPDGKTIQQKVRVVATGAGQIIKSTMSR